jgi:excisionase family DNA binding protein
VRKTSYPNHTIRSAEARTPHHASAPDQLLTVEEVMARLHLSRATVYDLIRSKRLNSGRVGRARRIPESAVAAFICQITESEG